MFTEYLQSKVHMATITEVNADYHGSLTLDRQLMDAAGINVFQKILVANATNGSRFETYVIEGDRGSGVVALNGAAALLGNPGDKIIGMTFCSLSAQEASQHKPRIVLVSEKNKPLVLSLQS